MVSFNRTADATLVATVLALAPTTACFRTGSEDAPPSEAPKDAVSARPTVPPGTTMTFIVDETVSSDDARAGDTFMSTLAGDAMGVDGRSAVPAGTLGRWIVLEVTGDNGEGEALLVVGLDAVRVAGRWYPVEATVTSMELDKDAKDSDAETAAKIGIGAAAGALAGRILGKSSRSTLKGAGVGAAMGTAVALSTRGASAVLRKGARVGVHLDRELVLDDR